VGADYSHFHRETYGLEPFDQDDSGVNAGRLSVEQRSFVNSLDSLGVQLASILATKLRHALNGNLQIAGRLWEPDCR
jgi:hypothetical protein